MSVETETQEQASTQHDSDVQAAPESTPMTLDKWRDALPDDIKGSPSLEGVEDVQTLAKRFIDTKRMVGANTVKIPGKEASQEEWAQFYTKLGRPESSDKYEMPKEGLPEGFEPNEGRLTAMREAAHRVGLTAQQFAALARADAEYMETEKAAFGEKMTQTQQESIAGLKKEWGSAFDQNLDLAKRAVRHFGGDDLVKELDDSGMGNHPTLAKAMAKIGRMIAEDEIVGGGRNQQFSRTPGEAKSQITQLYANKDFMAAYTTPHNPGHKDAVEKMRQLMAEAHPDEQPETI